MNKADARSEIKRRYSILNHSEKEKETKILFSKAIEYFDKYNSVASYASLSDEFPTKVFNKLLIEKGTEVFLPRSNLFKKQLDFCPVDSATEYKINSLGISEPEFIKEKKASFEAILIPMVGFSESYKRLGRGGGFYDRYVKNLNKKIIKIGIAYKYQRIKFDEQEFDMMFDQIIVSD
jgi:5-formyltetrahydrofolate cyclo-ligase